MKKMTFSVSMVVAAAAFATEIFSFNSPRNGPSRAEVVPIDGPDPRREHDSFSDLRHEMLGIIGGATKRLWLVTPYLTDGEIATSLFMAKYRKLDVKVLLGRNQANSYMSRLSFLKKQNIPVFLTPANFAFNTKTAVLSDDRLVVINSDLNVKSNRQKYSSEDSTVKETREFLKIFQEATDQKIPAIPRPTPYVGRPGRFNNVYKSGNTPQTSAPTARNEDRQSVSSSEEGTDQPPAAVYGRDGAYNYNYKKAESAPEGLPKKLPKQTIQQKKFMEEFRNSKN